MYVLLVMVIIGSLLKILPPLVGLLKKNAYKWTEEAQASFEALKESHDTSSGPSSSKL